MNLEVIAHALRIGGGEEALVESAMVEDVFGT